MQYSPYNPSTFYILPPIAPESRWLFLIVMSVFIAAIIWHAKRFHDGW